MKCVLMERSTRRRRRLSKAFTPTRCCLGEVGLKATYISFTHPSWRRKPALAAEVAVPCCGQVVSSCLHGTPAAAVAAPTGAPCRWNEKTPFSSPFAPPPPPIPPHPPTTSTHPTTLLVRCLHYCGALAAWICPDCFLKFSRLLLRGEDAA